MGQRIAASRPLARAPHRAGHHPEEGDEGEGADPGHAGLGVLALEPDNSTALNALGYMLANRTERFSEAETLIARALEISPDEPAILDSWGWVKYRLGDYTTALDYLQRAYRAFPDPEVAAHLGEVLWAMGEDDAAVVIWDRALSESPEHKILLETIRRLGANLADR